MLMLMLMLMLTICSSSFPQTRSIFTLEVLGTVVHVPDGPEESTSSCFANGIVVKRGHMVPDEGVESFKEHMSLLDSQVVLKAHHVDEGLLVHDAAVFLFDLPDLLELVVQVEAEGLFVHFLSSI